MKIHGYKVQGVGFAVSRSKEERVRGDFRMRGMMAELQRWYLFLPWVGAIVKAADHQDVVDVKVNAAVVCPNNGDFD